MQITINIEKKYFIILILFIGLVGLSFAYNDQTYNNPAVFGHSFDEMVGESNLGYIDSATKSISIIGQPYTGNNIVNIEDILPDDGQGTALKVVGHLSVDGGIWVIEKDGSAFLALSPTTSSSITEVCGVANPKMEGAIYYNKNIYELCYCNGVGWKKVSNPVEDC